jgi:hypothetical protein
MASGAPGAAPRRRSLGLLLALVAGRTGPRAPRRQQSAFEVTGAWLGSVTHDADSTPFGLEIEPAKEGMVTVKLSVPPECRLPGLKTRPTLT